MRESSRRKVHRLKGHDYSLPGDYFVTICTARRLCVLGHISGESMRLSDCGAIVHSVWQELASAWPHVSFGASVIMPNHLHGIIVMGCEDPSGPLHMISNAPIQKHYGSVSVADLVRRFKALASYRIHRSGAALFGWQANYWDHIIRDEHALERIADYIVKNPRNWQSDVDNVEREVAAPEQVGVLATLNGLIPADLPLVGISPQWTSMT